MMGTVTEVKDACRMAGESDPWVCENVCDHSIEWRGREVPPYSLWIATNIDGHDALALLEYIKDNTPPGTSVNIVHKSSCEKKEHATSAHCPDCGSTPITETREQTRGGKTVHRDTVTWCPKCGWEKGA